MKTYIKLTSVILLTLLVFSCKKPPALNLPEPPNPFPKLTTVGSSAITFSSAVVSGNITSGGALALVSVGICWDVNPNPTTLNSKTINGAGVGAFSANLTPLNPSTTYYARAYATNGYGTAYGEQISFKTADIWTLFKSGLSFRQMVLTPVGMYGFNDGSYPEIYYSSDNAATWAGLTVPPLTSINDLKQKNPYLFISGIGGVYRSTDNGTVWEKTASLPLGRDVDRVATIEVVGNDIFVGVGGADGGIYKSTDDGENWSISDAGIPSTTKVYKLWSNAGTFFAGTTTGVYKSTDNGATWALSSTGIPNGLYIYDFAAIGTRIYTHTRDQAVYYSDDNGATWADMSTGLPSTSIVGIRSFFRYNNDLYISADSRGVYVLPAGTTTWNLFNPGLTIIAGASYSLIEKNNTLYLCEKLYNGTTGKIYKYTLN